MNQMVIQLFQYIGQVKTIDASARKGENMEVILTSITSLG
jgi:hypothetical protein